MDINQFMTVISILSAICFVGLLFQKLLAIKAKSQGELCYFQDLQSYFPIFKKGWKIICENRWVFWLILGICLINLAYEAASRFLFYKMQQVPLPLEKPTFFGIISSLKFSSLSAILGSARSMNVFSDIPILNPLIILAILIMARPFKRLLNTISDSSLNSSKNFLQKNFWPTVAVAGIFLISHPLFNWYSALRFTKWFPGSLDFPAFSIARIVFAIAGLYLACIVVSLLQGAILTAFKEARYKRKVEKSLVLSCAVRHFKHLFFFNLLFFAISYLPHIMAVFQRIRFRATLFSYYSPAITIVLLFVAYLIVGRDYDFKGALKENFLLWRRRLLEIIVFIFIGVGLLWIPHLLSGLGRHIFLYPFNTIPRAIITGIRVFAGLWIAATLMLFLLRITEKQPERLVSNDKTSLFFQKPSLDETR